VNGVVIPALLGLTFVAIWRGSARVMELLAVGNWIRRPLRVQWDRQATASVCLILAWAAVSYLLGVKAGVVIGATFAYGVAWAISDREIIQQRASELGGTRGWRRMALILLPTIGRVACLTPWACGAVAAINALGGP
jgi:hypothetical protein